MRLCHLTAEWEDFGVHEIADARAIVGTDVYCSNCGRKWAQLEIFNTPSAPAHLPCQDCWDARAAYSPPGALYDIVAEAGIIDSLPWQFWLRECYMWAAWAPEWRDNPPIILPINNERSFS